MIKAWHYQVNPAVLWNKITEIFYFFASQRSYSYALAQEKQNLTNDFSPQILARAT